MPCCLCVCREASVFVPMMDPRGLCQECFSSMSSCRQCHEALRQAVQLVLATCARASKGRMRQFFAHNYEPEIADVARKDRAVRAKCGRLRAKMLEALAHHGRYEPAPRDLSRLNSGARVIAPPVRHYVWSPLQWQYELAARGEENAMSVVNCLFQ